MYEYYCSHRCLAADLLGEAAPVAIGDVLADLVMEDAISLRLFLDEPLHMVRVDVEDTTSDIEYEASASSSAMVSHVFGSPSSMPEFPAILVRDDRHN
jgi:hypothetical protein